MNINNHIYILFFTLLLTATLAFSQTEEQRKYVFENNHEIENFILSSGTTEALSTHFHSEYTYYDIYLDTPDFLLLRTKLSLRFRKRITDDKKRPITYGFQLKSEMDSLNSVRMEIEETELDFYMVKSDTGWVPLPTLLDSLFEHYDKHPDQPESENIVKTIQLIESWIQFKAEGAIAPFQRLRHLGFVIREIQSLRPVTCGKTIRRRSHIYASAEQSEQLNLERNRKKTGDLPKFFKKNPGHNWLLESSLDLAVFYPLYTSKEHVARISEYEVENKFFQPEIGRQVLEIYEAELIAKFRAIPKMDSKYKQAMDLFGEER